MRRGYGVLGIALLGAGLAAWWLRGEPGPEISPPSAAASGTASLEPAAEARATVPAGPGADVAPAPEDPPKRILPEELELRFEAERRFEQALIREGVIASEIRASVLELFSTVVADPVVEQGGLLKGALMRQIPADHPFERAGIRVGDLLVKLDGRSIRDPGDLPDIVVRLGARFEACVLRDDVEICTEIQAEPPRG